VLYVTRNSHQPRFAVGLRITYLGQVEERPDRWKPDPRAVLVSLGIVSSFPFLLDGWGPTLLSMGILLVLTVHRRIPARILVRRMFRVTWFVVFITLVNGVSGDGHVLLTAGPVAITREGLFRGAELSVRVVTLLWGSTVLLWTVPPAGIVDAFEGFLPRRKSGETSVAMLLRVTVNLVPALIQQARRVSLSCRARGLAPTGISGRLEFLSAVGTPLFAGIARTAHQLATAMESRCFDVSRPRSSFFPLRFCGYDWMMIGGTTCLACLAASLL